MGWAALKALMTGFVSYIVQVLLKKAESRLAELRSAPEEESDIDLEELLDYFILRSLGEGQSLDPLPLTTKIEIIRLSAATYSAYLHLKIRKLASRREPRDV